MHDNDAQDKNPYRYCGEYLDFESGYVYLRARYYDPAIGRFISEDPAFDGYNWYAYCGGNPVNRWDPSGHAWWNPFDSDSLGARLGEKAYDLVQAGMKKAGNVTTNIVKDTLNFDLNNTSEQKVIDSNFFSAYKGQFVIRTPFSRSFSWGIMGLEKGAQNRSDGGVSVVQHEWGHYYQLKELGVLIPSALSDPSVSNIEYYSRPWEVTADMYGGVEREHLSGSELVGEAYLKLLKKSKEELNEKLDSFIPDCRPPAYKPK